MYVSLQIIFKESSGGNYTSKASDPTIVGGIPKGPDFHFLCLIEL